MFIALVFLAHIYVDLIVSATNVLVVFLSTINKHFLLLLLLLLYRSICTNVLALYSYTTRYIDLSYITVACGIIYVQKFHVLLYSYLM